MLPSVGTWRRVRLVARPPLPESAGWAALRPAVAPVPRLVCATVQCISYLSKVGLVLRKKERRTFKLLFYSFIHFFIVCGLVGSSRCPLNFKNKI